MSVVLLDPRFPAMIPVEAIPLLSGDVAYTEEVPVRVRWTILDLGGHTNDDADVLVTTDVSNPLVRERLDAGQELVTAPSLLVEMEPQRQLEGGSASASSASSMSDATSASTGSSSTPKGPQMPSAGAVKGDFSKPAGAGAGQAGAGFGAGAGGAGQSGQVNAAGSGVSGAGAGQSGAQSDEQDEVSISGGGYVDGEIVGTDEHTAAVAGLRRTARTEVPASVMDEIEDAVALMARALRQGEWEQGMTHTSLISYLREETEELARIVGAMEKKASEKSGEKSSAKTGVQSASGAGVKTGELKSGDVPQWMEQELCKELSDVLLQVLFHAEIANRRGAFDIGHVAGAFTAKLQSRAPYLFESVERQVPKTEQDRLWEEGKKRERAEREKSLGKEYAELVDSKDKAAAEASAAPAAGASTAGSATAANSAATSAVGSAESKQSAASAASGADKKSGSNEWAKQNQGAQSQPGQGTQSQAGQSGQPQQASQNSLPQQTGQNSLPQQSGQRVEPHAQSFPVQKAAAGQAAAQGASNEVSGLQAAEDIIREARELGVSDIDIPMDIRYPMVGLEMDKPGEADRRLKDAVANFREVLKKKSQS